jgi:hypothetical protein
LESDAIPRSVLFFAGLSVWISNMERKNNSPINKIESTKAYKLLSGVRGEKPSDIESIIECLQRLSQLVIDFPRTQNF